MFQPLNFFVLPLIWGHTKYEMYNSLWNEQNVSMIYSPKSNISISNMYIHLCQLQQQHNSYSNYYAIECM